MMPSEFDPPIVDPESESLHLAVWDVLLGHSDDLGALADLLRSGHEIHPLVRKELALAAEGKGVVQVVVRRQQAGRPRSIWAPAQRAFRNVAIAEFIDDRIAAWIAEDRPPRGLQKKAVGEACAKFGLSEGVIKEALKKGRPAAAEMRRRKTARQVGQFEN